MSDTSNTFRPVADAPQGIRSHRGTVTPSRAERYFGIDEIFFSTTDRKGIIRSGNPTFSRVSGYDVTELVGSPHNIVRHPEMPRAVFQLLWEELEAGRPVAAYVNNLARDGRYYWVMATVMPCPGGYLSVRIKPSTPYFEAVHELYADICQREQDVEDGDPRRRKPAIAAGRSRLNERLAELGYTSYGVFMRAALLAEVKSRIALARATVTTPPSPVHTDANLSRMLTVGTTIGTFVDGLVTKLDDYADLNRTLLEKAQIIVSLSDEISASASSTQAAAARTGTGEAMLGEIAGALKTRANASGPAFQALQREVAAAAEVLSDMFFPVAAASLQSEILNVFIQELLADDQGPTASPDDLGALAHCLSDEVEGLAAGLIGLERRLGGLGQHIARLQADLGALRALQLKGRIQAARGGQVGAVDSLLQSTTEQIRTARRELDGLLTVGRASIREAAVQARSSRTHIDTLRDLVVALGAA